jgi:light-regulated signal transduction histidine kinase (bacteriophytochrome)
MLSKLEQARTLNDLCSETVGQIKDLIGFDRVMIYRFLPDGSGQVVAEAREPDQTPLLNLRYPASDIPVQARELYKRNWVRLISDVNASPVPILATPEAADRPLDLSFADLRSVSPIHIEYLRNMSVGASMSISIIVGGDLWGLIACHNRTAAKVPANIRSAAELLGQVFSLQIQTVEGIEAYVTMRAARALLDRIVSEFPVDGDLLSNLSARLDQLAAFIPCDGVGIFLERSWSFIGNTPGANEAQQLAAFVDGQNPSGIWASEQLGETFRPATDWPCGIRGMLAVPLSRGNGDWLFFFRGEFAQSIEWGGDPNKPMEPDGPAGRISPRKSFEAWKQEVRGQSRPWTSREKLIADTLRIYLLDIIVRFREVILEERRQAHQRQRLMISELNHRVKGTLELIQSLLLHGYEEPSGVQKFVRTLEGRIKAISLAHDVTSVASSSQLRSLVEGAIAMQQASAARVDIHGPAVRLDAKAHTVLALVLHELAANSSVSGALASSNVTLAINWLLDSAGRLVLVWDEAGLPHGGSNKRDALSAIIVNRNIPHALGGEASVEQDEHGVRATFVIPARFLVERAAGEIVARPSIAPPQAPRRSLEGYSILVVEDQTPAAIDLERQLQERGAASVAVAGTMEAALDILANNVPDVAILDIDLGESTSIIVADELARQSIPFIFAGSEFDADLIPHRHQEVQRVSKPYSGDAVAERLRDALLPHLIRAVLTRLV